MNLTNYKKDSLTKFMGLYKRGIPDNCPQDHSICNENCNFNKAGEVLTRDGMIASMNAGHPVIRFFLSITTAGGAQLLTLDESGNIYKDSDPTPIFSYGGVIDFSALNLGPYTYILPISAFGGTPANLQVWDGVASVTRDAAGLPPSASFTASDGAAGNVDVGTYQIAVSFVTASGFTTPPGPNSGTFNAVIYNAPGSKKIDLSGLPLGPTGTTARQIIITKANELEFFFLGVSAGGFINDNTTTTTTLDFFDTDLAISADYLFDLMPVIPSSAFSGSLLQYHARLCITNQTAVVKASRVQDQESFNMVDGLIQCPTEGGQAIYGLCQQRDILYCMSFPGIFMAEDNTLEPSFWPITLIDGGVGSFGPGIGSLSGTTNALSSREIFLLCDRNGLFKFNGSVDAVALTWKIDDIWKSINFNVAEKISCIVDIFHDILYVIAPIGNGTLPGIMLMGDYSEGLDAMNIKWSFWTFPYTVIAATIINYTGNLEPSTGGYFLRIAFQETNEFIYAIKPGQTTDQGGLINSYYMSYLSTSDTGSVNIFRNIRARATGSGLIQLTLNAQDFNPTFLKQPPKLLLSETNAQDIDRQINFMNEKMSVTFGVDPVNGTPGDTWALERLDIFAARKFQMRPQ